jgi:hypothetical protein
MKENSTANTRSRNEMRELLLASVLLSLLLISLL